MIQQGADVVVLVGLQVTLHGHADEPDAVLLRQTDVAVAGNVSVADLRAQNGRDIVPAGPHPHLILLVEVPGHGLDVGGGHRVHLVPGEKGLKARLGQRPAQDLRHIVAAGVVVLVADAMGVREVGVLQAQLRYLCVHRGHTVGDGAAAEIFRQQVRAVVGAGHHGGIQRIRQGNFLPFLQCDVAGISTRQRVNVLVADGQLHAVPLALRLFTGKAQRHHLGDRRRVQFLIHILLRQHQPGVRVNDAVSFGGRQGRGRRRVGRKGRQQAQQGRAQHGDLFFHLVYSVVPLICFSIPHFAPPEKRNAPLHAPILSRSRGWICRPARAASSAAGSRAKSAFRLCGFAAGSSCP